VDPELYALVLSELEIYVLVHEFEPKLHERIMARWQNTNMKWCFKRRALFPKLIPEGRKTVRISDLWPNPRMIPSRMAAIFVYSDAYLGTYTQATAADPKKYYNMYNFLREFGPLGATGTPENEILSAKLLINSVEVDGLAGNSATSEFFRSQILQHSYEDKVEQDLDLNDYLGGSAFFLYDLTNNLNGNQAYITPAIRDGNYQLEISFKTVTRQALYCLLYCEYPSTLEMSAAFILTGNFDLSGQR
jgi:hypothetical protein